MLGPWFHRIDFPGGISTKNIGYTGEDNDHPQPTWNRLKTVIPEDLTGKTVLDVGCNAGFYSFRCRERNAKLVVGVDARLWHVRQARFAASALGLDRVAFRRLSIYELSPEETGTYDIVLALGLIYHLKHLYQALENLYWITTELLIIETAVIPPELPWPEAGTYGVDSKRLEAVGVIANHWKEPEPPCNWFIPTPTAAKTLLEAVGFIDVCIDNIGANRAILSARKPLKAVDSTSPFGIAGKIEIGTKIEAAFCGSSLALTVLIKNAGRAEWLRPEDDAAGGVYLNGSSVRVDDPLIAHDLPWLPLPRRLKPGEVISVEYTLPPFDSPGVYEIEFDLIATGVGNFQDFGVSPLSFQLTVFEKS